MRYLTAYHTDIGTKKSTNQDSLVVRQAMCDCGPVLMASVCDGLGGLKKGEVASAAAVKALSDWFGYILPGVLENGLRITDFRESIEMLVGTLNANIHQYGRANGCELGTTLEMLLLVAGKYYIFHVGDCRTYYIGGAMIQLTKDQTYVQQQMDLGSMTPQQAKVDRMRNTLLQCIGASEKIQIDFMEGSFQVGDGFLICCDGFRHVVTQQEIEAEIRAGGRWDEAGMKNALVRLTETDKQRGETDNITSVLVAAVE
ncbi:MAG: serine/threonine-protein phosphatase [Lachnospiraceae bacterium]|nr:serine/threonine-protein phosphatase [Lachnospiraceae bacterium]